MGARAPDPPSGGGTLGSAPAKGKRPGGSSVIVDPSSSPASSPSPGFVRPTFEQLYASVRRWLPHELRRLGAPDADAEDLLHDVVLIAHRGLDHFHPSAARRAEHDAPVHALRAWILGIAWRQVTKRNRKARVCATALQEVSSRVALRARAAPSAEHALAANDRRRILIGVLARLMPCRADVLVLAYVAEMSALEIAQELGMNLNTVKSRLARGRLDVREAIKRLPAEQRSALAEALVPSERGSSLLPEVGMAEGSARSNTRSSRRGEEGSSLDSHEPRRGRIPARCARP